MQEIVHQFLSSGSPSTCGLGTRQDYIERATMIEEDVVLERCRRARSGGRSPPTLRSPSGNFIEEFYINSQAHGISLFWRGFRASDERHVHSRRLCSPE